jgi:curved DNA-binding protein CbpA
LQSDNDFVTHYEEFGVSSGATTEEIRQAHRNLARILHPDNFQDDALRRLAEAQMKRINHISRVLTDPSQRRTYDLRLHHGMPPELPARIRWKTAVPWAIAAAGIAFGFFPRPNGSPAPGKLPPEPPAAAYSQPAAPRKGPKNAAQGDAVRQLAEETRQLRRLLERAISDRDHALSRLNEKTSPLPAATPAPPPAPPATATASERPPPQIRNSPARPVLAGTWLYVPPAEPSPNELYPAEYIELVISDNHGSLSGRYRARYRVPDRALSPEVDFRFHTNSPAPDKVPWTGNGGAKGEMRLRMLSANRLAIEWFTSQFGAQLTLGSGTAVLVRGDGAVD